MPDQRSQEQRATFVDNAGAVARAKPESRTGAVQTGLRWTSEISVPKKSNPWIVDFEYTPNSKYVPVNIEWKTLKVFDTGWRKDVVGTGLLSALAGVATAVAARSLGLSELLSRVAGAASAFARSY